MAAFEHFIINLLLTVFTPEQLNLFLGDARTVAVMLGALIAICGALLGTFLLLRKMSLTVDAISHTVLLGIVSTFLFVSLISGAAPDLASPLLILGAAGAGVVTVMLTEALYRSGLVKQDAALGLAFPFLFALAVILVARYVDDVHLDVDSVMVGEIGVAWANTNSLCLDHCESVIITPEHPLAENRRLCVNCDTLNITPRDSRAVFEESCANCGTYTPAAAWSVGLSDVRPTLVYFPKALSIMGVLTLMSAAFVLLFYKELKLTTFDPTLASVLNFKPALLNYALMVMVSLIAVGAFDAVGSILVIAFFILPPATLYLLTDRLAAMLIFSPMVGALAAYTGYDLASGWLFGIPIGWNTSISASIVLMMFLFFVLAWVFSPRYGLIAAVYRRAWQRRSFAEQIVLGHIYHHEDTPDAAHELAADSLHTHFKWSQTKTGAVLSRLRARGLLDVNAGCVCLTPRGQNAVEAFRASLGR